LLLIIDGTILASIFLALSLFSKRLLSASNMAFALVDQFL
jgi:hypothetical protein